MGDAAETRRVVESFFAAWTKNKKTEARALMADDLEYWGPLNTYKGADAFLGPLMGFAQLVKSARMLECICEGDRAGLLYECELPAPVGVLVVSAFQRVEKGKIRAYRNAFDTFELRKLLGK
jgi:hypothetical protein